MTNNTNGSEENPAMLPKLSRSQADTLKMLTEGRRLFQRGGQWLLREPGYVIAITANNAEVQELHDLGYIEMGHITDAGRNALESWLSANPNSFL
jgi:hypothetical protein